MSLVLNNWALVEHYPALDNDIFKGNSDGWIHHKGIIRLRKAPTEKGAKKIMSELLPKKLCSFMFNPFNDSKISDLSESYLSHLSRSI